MGNKFYEENDIQNIANSIRNKGVSGNFTVAQMASNIDNISTGGEIFNYPCVSFFNNTSSTVYTSTSSFYSKKWNIVDKIVPVNNSIAGLSLSGYVFGNSLESVIEKYNDLVDISYLFYNGTKYGLNFVNKDSAVLENNLGIYKVNNVLNFTDIVSSPINCRLPENARDMEYAFNNRYVSNSVFPDNLLVNNAAYAFGGCNVEGRANIDTIKTTNTKTADLRSMFDSVSAESGSGIYINKVILDNYYTTNLFWRGNSVAIGYLNALNCGGYNTKKYTTYESGPMVNVKSYAVNGNFVGSSVQLSFYNINFVESAIFGSANSTTNYPYSSVGAAGWESLRLFYIQNYGQSTGIASWFNDKTNFNILQHSFTVFPVV